LKKIKIIFDYSNNKDTAMFVKMSFKQGEWEYLEIDDLGNLIYRETSNNGNKVTYEYEDNLLIKEHCNDKDIFYSYDSMNNIKKINNNGEIIEYDYDKHGEIIKEYTYHESDPSEKIYSFEVHLDEKGNELEQVNAYGEVIKEEIVQSYDDEGNLVSHQVEPKVVENFIRPYSDCSD
jgi:YD repeat-containing protein